MKQIKLAKKLTMLVVAGLLSVAGAVTSLASTRLDTVEGVYWDEEDKALAVWDEVEDAYQYQVYLYCDESKVAEIKTKKTQYDFGRKMTKSGDYMFRVRALAKGKSYRDGYWSEYSDALYIDKDFAELMENGGVIDTNNSGPGAKHDGSGATKASSVVYRAEWMQDNIGWWYRREDGSYPANTWWQDPADGIWYYFNEQGYMVTGWIDWNGSRYYCLPSGAMATGENIIDGVVYHFDGSGALMQ